MTTILNVKVGRKQAHRNQYKDVKSRNWIGQGFNLSIIWFWMENLSENKVQNNLDASIWNEMDHSKFKLRHEEKSKTLINNNWGTFVGPPSYSLKQFSGGFPMRLVNHSLHRIEQRIHYGESLLMHRSDTTTDAVPL